MASPACAQAHAGNGDIHLAIPLPTHQLPPRPTSRPPLPPNLPHGPLPRPPIFTPSTPHPHPQAPPPTPLALSFTHSSSPPPRRSAEDQGVRKEDGSKRVGGVSVDTTIDRFRICHSCRTLHPSQRLRSCATLPDVAPVQVARGGSYGVFQSETPVLGLKPQECFLEVVEIQEWQTGLAQHAKAVQHHTPFSSRAERLTLRNDGLGY